MCVLQPLAGAARFLMGRLQAFAQPARTATVLPAERAAEGGMIAKADAAGYGMNRERLARRRQIAPRLQQPLAVDEMGDAAVTVEQAIELGTRHRQKAAQL